MEEELQQQQQQLTLPRVPAELQKRIANFLSYRDAFRYSRVNTQIQECLGMSKIRLPYGKGNNFKWTSTSSVRNNNNGDIPCRSHSLPLVMRNRVHTVLLRGMYHDQGYGDNKGKLYVVASSSSSSSTTTTSSSGKRRRRHCVVAESPTAKHRESPLELVFNTVDDDVNYTLWYKVGASSGAAGHHHHPNTLYVSNLSMELILFDEPGLYISKNFHALDSRGALSLQDNFHFHFMLLRKVSRVLLEQMENCENPDINMTSFMESTGIDMNPKSLLALDQITSSMMETSTTTTIISMVDDDEGSNNNNNNNHNAEEENKISQEEEDDEIRRQCFPWAQEEEEEEEAPPDDDDVQDDDDDVVPPVAPRRRRNRMEVMEQPPHHQGEIIMDDDVDLFVGMERDMEDMEAMIRRAMQDD